MYFLVSNRKKHTCGDQECKKKLRAETCLEHYGVDHINKNKEIKQKGAKCFEKRYGKNSLIHEEFIKSREETCIKKHGTRNGSDPSKSSETRSKAVSTMIANFENAKCKKGTKKVLASQEQVHICELLNGVLNFDFLTRSIDIAFPEEKIAIEYDGGGHAYWNSFHSQDDSQRDSELLENNWKLIHIINSRDNVFPQDSDFLKIISYSKKILNSASLIYVNFIKHTISYDDTVIKLSDDNVLQGGVVE
jgi:very-short-patch-repair endonuclease